MAPVEVAAGAASVEVAAVADQENASAEVAADADPAEIKTQRQMAGQMTTSVWHLLTQRHRRSG